MWWTSRWTLNNHFVHTSIQQSWRPCPLPLLPALGQNNRSLPVKLPVPPTLGKNSKNQTAVILVPPVLKQNIKSQLVDPIMGPVENPIEEENLVTLQACQEDFKLKKDAFIDDLTQ